MLQKAGQCLYEHQRAWTMHEGGMSEGLGRSEGEVKGQRGTWGGAKEARGQSGIRAGPRGHMDLGRWRHMGGCSRRRDGVQNTPGSKISELVGRRRFCSHRSTLEGGKQSGGGPAGLPA